ncbi:hypothetical protein ES705_41141 [subsurface metagenome]
MTVAETIKILNALREEKVIDLSVLECHAIGIAIVVLVALEPSQCAMIDQFLAMHYSDSN